MSLDPVPLEGDLGDLEGPDVNALKRELREAVKALVAVIPPEERAEASARVCDAILAAPEYLRAKSLLIYMALPDEVDLGAVIAMALETGREVFLPVVDTARRSMSVVSVADPARDMREGALGVLEPARGLPLGDLSAIDLVLTPGRAFDRRGGRLGRGGGYYDGFLARLAPAASGGPPKLGVCFSAQIVDEVPCLPRDIRVDGVLTEDGRLAR